jgi:sugar phosphate isomerase/epimerase
MLKISACISPNKAEFAPLLFSGRIEEGLTSANKYGYDGVELNILDSDQLDQEQLLAQIRRLELDVFAIATGQSYITDGYSLYNPDAGKRQNALGRLKSHIHFAAKIGCYVIVGGMRGRLSPADVQNAEIIDQGNAALASINQYAFDHDVSLLLEPINRYETNIVNTIAEAIELIEHIGGSNIKLLLDTFHMNIEEQSLEKSFLAAGDRLGYVHFADSNRLAPGWGHLDFASVVSALKQMQYQGAVGMEILPKPDDDQAIRQAIEHVKAIERLTIDT